MLSHSNIRLGIDTGGTYTDAALVGADGEILASSKALTTHYDLSIGIKKAVVNLSMCNAQDIALTSLSTTLATNAIVEKKGSPIGLLLPGYTSIQVQRMQFQKLLPDSHFRLIRGGHDAGGHEVNKLDIETVKRTVLEWEPKISAIGISSIFGIRNPSHEIMLKNLVREHTNLPITCGHELALSLDAPRRAITVAINASLIAIVSALIKSVQNILSSQKIGAPLMIVKGDGSLIAANMALERPVETIISGPAASVIGACHLGQSNNAIVADMGGTTTDIAIVTDGTLNVCKHAAIIGDWKPMVNTIRIISVGLGADSEVRFKGGKGPVIGPRRVIPMSLLGYRYPNIISELSAQLSEFPTTRSNRFALRVEQDRNQLGQMSSIEHDIWQLLGEGPLQLEGFAKQNPGQSKSIASLVRKGLAIYSGFTPTDAAHVLKFTNHWSREAAELSAQIWSKQMRYVYGWGTHTLDDATIPARLVHNMVIREILNTLVHAGLLWAQPDNEFCDLKKASLMVSQWLMSTDEQLNNIFTVRFKDERKLIAVGGPAHIYYRDVSERLNLELNIPQCANVANAVGAAVGVITQREQITITQLTNGLFRAHGKTDPIDFTLLEDAVRYAESETTRIARSNASCAGAEIIDIVTERKENSVKSDDQSETIFFECLVTTTACGQPMTRAFGNSKTA